MRPPGDYLDLNAISHTIVRLQLHLEGKQTVLHNGMCGDLEAAMERNAKTQINFFEIVAAEKKHPLSRDQLIRCGLDPPLRAPEFLCSQFLE